MAEAANTTLDAVAPTSESIERYETEQPSAVSIRSLDDIKRISTIFIGSGMFKGQHGLSQEQQLYQAGVKIIAGVEFGIQPFAAMRGINIINGNAEMSANLMAAKVKTHPKYDYRVPTWTNEQCVVEFVENVRGVRQPVKLGESSFTIEDARRAGLLKNPTWEKFPRNMLFARAMSNGVRIYTPDVFYGAPVYVEGEISGEFDQTPEKPEASQPVEAEIVDAAAPDVDQMATQPEPSRDERKAAAQAVEAEVAAEEEAKATTQWDAHEVAKEATPDPLPVNSKLSPKKTARIYSLGSRLNLDRHKLEERVQALVDNKEADEAIAILEGDLAKREAES